MHPRARAFLRAELDVLLTLPRLAREALGARREGPAGALRYSQGDFGPAVALALTPPMLAEAAMVHLLLPPGWIAAHVVTPWRTCTPPLALRLGGGLARLSHRLAGGALIARSGPLYRARVPLAAVADVVVARERVPDPGGLGFGALVVRDGVARLVGRGRVDVRLELSRPVPVQRPLRDPRSW